MANPAVSANSDQLFRQWGVSAGPALWPVVLRILIVVDGRITTSTCPDFFGLGYMLETLRDPTFSWWVRFKVQVVRRDAAPFGNPQNCLVLDTNYSEGADPAFVRNFRFTDPRFNIDDWDEIWFFGDYPANINILPITDPLFQPMEDGELQLIAEWMERGGGVFAAGDHWNLGASMCSRIPRVRTMRRWKEEDGIPPQYGRTRHETLQHVPVPPMTSADDYWETDTTPQPLELVNQSRLGSILVRPFWAHPLVTMPGGGVIDTFPDHMHEGDVVDDVLVNLDKPLDIPNYNRPEYPYEQPVISPAVAESVITGVQWRPRPRPHVVAYGRTTIPRYPDDQHPPLARIIDPGLPTTRFGLVGAYDGDAVNLGRVVVDSTWHHWFTLNLDGFKVAHDNGTETVPVYTRMQAYYRNVALWLARQTQRQSLLIAASWGAVVSDSMAFPRASDQTLWSAGKKAIDVMSRTVSEPMLFDWVASFFKGGTEKTFGVPFDLDPDAPYASAAPVDLASRAIVGGIASALVEPATRYLQAPRRLLDAGEIARQASQGVAQGKAALVDALQSTARESEAVAARLADAFAPSPGPVGVETVSLRIVAERLQFPDPTDPALATPPGRRSHPGPGHLTVSIRAVLGGSVAGSVVIQDLEIPAFHPAGAFVDLQRVVYEGPAQSGQSLDIEVVAGLVVREPVPAGQLRFNASLDSDPSSWSGSHAPDRTQAWRLWYRVENTAAAH
jgi:hypothetical protein